MSVNHDSFRDLCEGICRDGGWELLPNGIRVSWPGGRRQLVSFDFFEHQDQEVVRLYTRIGPVEALDEETLVMALRVNAGLAHGALAVMHDALVMIDTQMLRDADLGEVKASIDFLARTADCYEKTLFCRDAY